MSTLMRKFLLWGLAIVLAAGCGWLWFHYMEKRWEAVPFTSEAAQKNPMLAAQRWLVKNQHPTTSFETLAQVPLGNLQNGTLLLVDNGGIITPDQSAQLLDWVRRGNTLIMRPAWSRKANEAACGQAALAVDADEEDSEKASPNAVDMNPISTHLGLKVARRDGDKDAQGDDDDDTELEDKKTVAKTACMTALTLPQVGYPLHMNVEYNTLLPTSRTKTPVLQDATGDGVRIYAEGAGYVVALARNVFHNNALGMDDNAELLLHLVKLNRQSPQAFIVQQLTMPQWYEWLWEKMHLGLISLVSVVLVLLWIGLHRFGPMLPQPQDDRRSLLEHIDASARWLWKIPGGAEILLLAARAATHKVLQRKVPHYVRLAPTEQALALAQHTAVPHAHIVSALFQPAGKLPADFTQQIQTLQQLRHHYER
jgi:hypothetical protein